MVTLPHKDDGNASSLRMLVVEDYPPFRQFVCSMLGRKPDLQVVGEAADGLEAVHKAEELRPDLIVLDIGLPALNGLEAARRIRKLAPESKIIFVTQESSADIVQEAVRLGASGYVLKTNAGKELLTAVEAVRQGKQFIGGGLSQESLSRAAAVEALGISILNERLDKKVVRKHEVQFYPDDASFVAGFTRFIETALIEGKAVIVLATPSHQKGLLQKLREDGVNIAAAIQQGRYLPSDVAETLATFMVNGRLDPVLFQKVTGDLIASAAKVVKGDTSLIAACGECAPTLLKQGRVDAAIQLEHLWDEVSKACGMDILCGYDVKDFQTAQENRVRDRVCAEHSAVLSV
jgi:DNA-binding NarL/FixJ family response regulator